VVDQSKLDQLNSQNEYLLAKLKEAKAELETQEVIEQKIISEYKLNMEQTKLELKVKTEQLVAQKDQIEDLNTTIRNLTARMEAISQTDSPSKKELKTQLLSRMEELEQELKETKEINSKLTDMESQLFDQIKIKEEERGELYEELRKKEARIQELEEIVEVREPEHLNTYSSHISQSTQKRESIKSQSSLKYSSHSQALRKSRMAASGKSGTSHEEKLFDLDLSEAGT
jgi:chromosome segregation ATPase